MFTKPSRLGGMPFEMWLGRGLPLSPYLKGHLIDYFRDQMRPKELKIAEVEFFPSEKVAEFLEWSAPRNWVSQWLKYCRWYYLTALSPDVNLDA